MNANAKLKNPSKSEHSNARYDLLKIKSNNELHIPMHIALNNRNVQNGIHKICHVLLMDGQNETRFSFVCFLIEIKFLIFFGTKTFFFFFFFFSQSHISGSPSKHYFISLIVNITEMK